MDRDAPVSSPPTSDVVPAHTWSSVRAVARVGVGLTAVAVALGLVAAALGGSTPWPLHTARLLLVFAGAVTAGAAVSMRPDLWQAWALSALAALLAVAGTPEHWDSFRLLFGVLTAVAATGALIATASPRWRYRVASALIFFHFGGIFLATVSPSPSPWLVDQTFTRVYVPYLQFTYLRNAYHFYSPQPGPASLDVFMLKTEVGREYGVPRYEYKWVILPLRPKDVRDPLGLSYVRRLSLTEQTAQVVPGVILYEGAEQSDVLVRRRRLAERIPGEPYYPLHPAVHPAAQYAVPRPDVMRYIIPSYAQHVILENTPDAETAARTSVKVYRIEHEMLTVQEYVKGADPFHPITYRPYFLGEFRFEPDPTDPDHRRTRITLADPQEKLLYWLVPILPRAGGPGFNDPTGKDYDDYLSAHALGVPVEELGNKPYADWAFNWSLLR
jgi:hypothetical protein